MKLTTLIGGFAIFWSGLSCMPPSRSAPAKVPTDAESKAEGSESGRAEKPTTSGGLPTECTQQGKICIPPGDFVERLCGNKYPGLAIVWFAKGTPWTRRYVRLPVVEPRNTTGGPSSDAKLVWGEEVLALKRHGGGGNVQVSGAVDYDVLRWDGTCASMSDIEMTPQSPGMPKNAPIVWKYLDSAVQAALLKDSAIQKASEAEGKACGGKAAGGGYVCEQANRNLNSAIASAVRKGIELPTPDRLP